MAGRRLLEKTGSQQRRTAAAEAQMGEDFVAIEIGGSSCDVALMRGGPRGTSRKLGHGRPPARPCGRVRFTWLELAAAKVVHLVTQAVMQAVEEITLGRGLDQRRFALVAGGGLRPRFGCEAADSLSIVRAFVPRRADAFCAFCLLAADIRLACSAPVSAPLDDASVATAAQRFGTRPRAQRSARSSPRCTISSPCSPMRRARRGSATSLRCGRRSATPTLRVPPLAGRRTFGRDERAAR